MKNAITLIGITFLLLILNGCSTKHRPTDIYALKYTTTVNSEVSSASTKIIKIATPKSTREIKRDNILYALTPSQRESYAYSRWSDTPNYMIETYIVALLDDSHLFETVLPASSAAHSSLLLESTIEDFYHAVEGEKSFGVIKMRFYLIDQQSKAVLSHRFFTAKKQAATTDAKGAVKALHDALKQIETGLIDWLKDY